MMNNMKILNDPMNVEMSTELKITERENQIINYLSNKDGQEVSWEELVQFAKDPQSVKIKTVKKTISEIKRKYNAKNLPAPFNVNFTSLLNREINTPVPEIKQKLVLVSKPVNTKHQAQIDFAIDDVYTKKVRTRFGLHQLNDNEWYVFKYFYSNVGKLIPISELRDKVVFPNYGSKLPARWFDSIMRIINCLRKQVIGLDKRLLTVKSSETSYIFQ